MQNIIMEIVTPSIVVSIIVSIFIYVLNIPYGYIQKPLSLSKYNKKNAIVFMILIFLINILGIFIFFIFKFYNYNNNIKSSKKIYSDIYILSVIIYYSFNIIFLIVSSVFSNKFKKNKLKFLSDKYCSKLYSSISNKIFMYSFLLVTNGINVILFLKFVLNNRIDMNYVVSSIYLLNMLLIIEIFSFCEAINKLINISLSNIKLKNNDIFYNCKIIYQNDKYTCIYYDQQIIHINTSEILLIKEEKPNEKNKSDRNLSHRKIIKKKSDIKLFRWIRIRSIKIIAVITGLIIMIFLIINAINHVSYDGLYGFLGGVIGGISTLVAIYLTLRSEANERRETKRMEVKPYLISELTNETSLDEKYCMPSGYMIFDKSSTDANYRQGIRFVNFINDNEKNNIYKCAQNIGIPFLRPNVIKITNIGLGPCLEVKTNIYKKTGQNYNLIIKNATPFFNLISGSFMTIAIVLVNYQYGVYKVAFTVKDIYKNIYNQYFEFAYEKPNNVRGHSQDKFSVYPITIPRLEK